MMVVLNVVMVTVARIKCLTPHLRELFRRQSIIVEKADSKLVGFSGSYKN